MFHVVRRVLNLHTVHEEDAPAEPILATCVFFIAIETQTQTIPFHHLVRGEAPLIALAAALLAMRCLL